MELIFCSFDKKDAEYKEYVSNMPWLCVPFDSPTSQLLGRKYKASGIPHLVVVDLKTGKLITSEGTSCVMEDEEGKEFPWRPKTFKEIWPDKILMEKGKDGAEDTFMNSSELKDKNLMLYFSASWCPPCRQFTPKLSDAYDTLKKKYDDFELVFVSSDREEETFDDYFSKKMSFLALPYQHRDVKAYLSSRFQIQGIPSLLILGPEETNGDRPLINGFVRPFIERRQYDEYPFPMKKYGDIGSETCNLNEEKALIIFGENCDDGEQIDIKDVMKEVAQKLKEEKKDEGFYFLWALESSHTTNQIRKLTMLPTVEKSEDPAMIILDIPDEGGYYFSTETDITTENVLKFIESPGDRLQLS